MRLSVVGILLFLSSIVSAQFLQSERIQRSATIQQNVDFEALSAHSIIQQSRQSHTTLSNSAYELKLRDSIVSLTGTHYHFDVFYNGHEVLDAEYHVHTRNGKAFLVQESIPEIFSSETTALSDAIWINLDGAWQLGRRSSSHNETTIKIEDETVFEQSHRLYYHKPDTQVSARVFLVNPLNTAEREYGSPYIDSNDLDVPQLNAERKWVNMDVHFENDTFWLRNDRYYFGQVSDPVLPETFSLTDTFDFTRSQYQFEDVNAYYHIVSMSDYVEALGFESALPDTLVIDAHAYSGGDFSSFNYGVSPVELEFGEGGVDDAEDGEIVVHEFAHSLSHFAGGDSYANTTDRSAMEEGNADYFSAAYSKDFTDFAWRKMFNWDGHNPFFRGIDIGAQLKYPNQLTGNTNADREMWSTPLMCLYDKIGRGPTDTLVLEHLYYQSKTGTMPQMANIIRQIDSMVFDGKYEADIRDCFSNHNLLASVPDAISSPGLWDVRNTNGFTEGSGSAWVTSKSGNLFSAKIYDQLGHLVRTYEQELSIEISPQGLESGIYFVELNSDEQRAHFKLLKP